jgi:hypothetical protein
MEVKFIEHSAAYTQCLLQKLGYILNNPVRAGYVSMQRSINFQVLDFIIVAEGNVIFWYISRDEFF